MKNLIIIPVLASLFLAAGCMSSEPAGDSFKAVNSIGLALINVEPGEFTMGSDQWTDDEKPVHKVKITTEFWIGKTEITQSQYEKISGKNPSLYEGSNAPAEQISWNDAIAFCTKLNELEKKEGRLPQGYIYRLPTEAEWEYACRAGTTGDFAGKTDDISWNGGNSKNSTQPVATKSPNPWGIYDMHGNVWEWCLDSCEYGEKGVKTDTYKDAAVDPVSTMGDHKILRGGSWCFDTKFLRSSTRYADKVDFKAADIGFRIVLAREIK
ncbi:MAG TPA: formylglycine-generating enzyme family protein [Lentisphaeria bacterium]|nr:MAG: hypothetical protein A2X48_05710 [Lentisphaerae bacterium GWF2_49_21]HBC86550.1 formylglycine-generating enzyme family protein [Lentisphaeria bacterium]